MRKTWIEICPVGTVVKKTKRLAHATNEINRILVSLMNFLDMIRVNKGIQVKIGRSVDQLINLKSRMNKNS